MYHTCAQCDVIWNFGPHGLSRDVRLHLWESCYFIYYTDPLKFGAQPQASKPSQLPSREPSPGLGACRKIRLKVLLRPSDNNSKVFLIV